MPTNSFILRRNEKQTAAHRDANLFSFGYDAVCHTYWIIHWIKHTPIDTQRAENQKLKFSKHAHVELL